jgi:hypothetical protein
MPHSFFCSQINEFIQLSIINLQICEIAEMDQFFHKQVVLNSRIRQKRAGSGSATLTKRQTFSQNFFRLETCVDFENLHFISAQPFLLLFSLAKTV